MPEACTSGTAPSRVVCRGGRVRRSTVAAKPRASTSENRAHDVSSRAHDASRREVCALLSGAIAGLRAQPVLAATDDIAGAYDKYASTYDVLDGGAFARDTLGLDALRRDLLGRASGEVLELGVGTGLNLPGYDMRRLESLTAVDISNGMLAQARERADSLGLRVQTEAEWAVAKEVETQAKLLAIAAASADGAPAPPPPPPKPKDPRPPVRLMLADAEALPFPDGSFDCVIDTFSLCVIENPDKALAEVKRVLRPGGTALLIEHSKSATVPLLGAYQELTGAAVKSLAKGCAWNQDVLRLLNEAGLRVVSAEPSLLGTITTIEATLA